MLLATTLRYMDLAKNTRFDKRFFTTKEYVTMAECYGFGLLAVMNEGGVAAAVSACDGLLLPGSAMPHPKELYEGEPPERPIVWDEYPLDSALVRAFFEAGKPILGICGGGADHQRRLWRHALQCARPCGAHGYDPAQPSHQHR